jgi:hypothetical protein
MEKLIFYIIVGVGYLIYAIYKAVRKAEEEKLERQRRMAEQAQLEAEARKQAGKITKQPQRTAQPAAKPAPRPVSQAPVTSLDDLLREFGLDTPKEITTAPAPIFQAPKYKPPVQQPAKPFVLDYDDNIEDEVVTAKKRQSEIDAEIARVKKEGVNEKGDFHLDPYKLKDRQANEYRDWMKDKSNIKKAFVASEIFKTKF